MDKCQKLAGCTEATESWVSSNITKEFEPIDINDVYAAFEAGAQWQRKQSQQDQERGLSNERDD